MCQASWTQDQQDPTSALPGHGIRVKVVISITSAFWVQDTSTYFTSVILFPMTQRGIFIITIPPTRGNKAWRGLLTNQGDQGMGRIIKLLI